MRIRTGKTKNGRLFYVIKTYYDSQGVEHTVTVEKLGNENDIRKRTGRDPDEWAKEYVAQLNEKEKQEKQDITLTFPQGKRIRKGHRRDFNVGYLFLQKMYHDLDLDKLCKQITKRHSFQYDLSSILSRSIYGRILEPCSKRATLKFAKALIEPPKFEQQHLYRSLDVLYEESDFIQQQLYQNSFCYGKRKTGVIYYDCTNFFFDIEQQDEDGLRKYGKSKENRPLPIVEMGLFTDQEGIPLGVCIHPGNTNEQTTLKPIEQRMISEYGMSKFVVCTDAGLASKANRRFNDVQGRAFIVTRSIKQMKKELKEWALSSEGWLLCGDSKKKKYDISKFEDMGEELLEKFYEKTFYKERWVDQGSFEEKIVVTYSLKYRQYQRNIRAGQIERAQKAIDNGNAKIKKYNQSDYRRFIEKTPLTDDGEVAQQALYDIDTERIKEEKRYDGFYAVCTNLDDDPQEIIKVNQSRWQIEECFRIMKSDFSARPAFVRTNAHIHAHFLICFIALTIYRLLEKKLGDRFTCDQILSTLRDMRMTEVLGEGYMPSYTRDDITDALYEAFGFRTDEEFITKERMKKILKESKKKI